MKKSKFKNNKILSLINKSFIILPSPLNISIWWNFGSVLGMFIIIQILSGFFLSIHYNPSVSLAFKSIIHIIQDVNNGWLIRMIHINGASMFFICMFLHIGRNIYFNLFLSVKTWVVGVLIFYMSMITAFVGYVLPWGQMSYWGATVITNLISVFPYIGKLILFWLWGGFALNNASLNRFYSFHFLFPFMILVLILFHLFFLHILGSGNPMGLNSLFFKVPIYPYFILKDLILMMIILLIFLLVNLLNPYILSDFENFNLADSMNTPKHIQPEWYFLFAYTILRSIPNKLGGVFSLILSLLMLIFIPFYFKFNFKSTKFYYLNQFFCWIFFVDFFIMTILGTKLIEFPFIGVSQILTFIYFFFFMFFPILNIFHDKILYKK